MPKISTILRIGLTILILVIPFIGIVTQEARFVGQREDGPVFGREMRIGFPGSGSGNSLTARLKTA